MRKILLSFFLLIFLNPILSHAQGIGPIRIQYSNPGTNNNLDVIAQVIIPSQPAFRISNSSRISNDTLYLTACYYAGMFTAIAQLTDTISIGSPPPGLTTLQFRMLISGSPTQCTPFASAFINQPFAISSPSGIKPTIAKTEILLYPNPAKDFIFLKNQNAQRIILRDLTGKVMQIKNLQSEQEFKLDLSSTNKGIYLVEIITRDGQSYFRRIVKE